MTKRPFSTLIPVALLATLTACARQDDEIVRTYSEVTTRVFVQPGNDGLPDNHPLMGGGMPPADAMAGAAAPAAPGGDMAAMADQVTAGSLRLSWDTPAGWTEKAGTGVRLVTFVIDGSECTITAFPGSVGGNEANVRRWLGQLNVELSPAELTSFVNAGAALATRGGLKGTVFDFDSVLPAGADEGMLAAVIEAGDQSAFVKWMGPRNLLRDGRAAFLSLCESLAVKETY